jgi:beta-phosphoglucomutase-like phosphatase (HAD superfamily)
MNKKISGIIFDFNGVLWWDTPLQEQTWNTVAEKLRHHPFTLQELREILHGRGSKYILEYLAHKTLNNGEVEKLTEEKEIVYRELCLQVKEQFKLSPGATDLLDFLVEHNISRNIATSSRQKNVDFFFEHLNLAKWFERDKVAYDDGKIRGKPYPDIYLKAALNIGLMPEECIAVEDAMTGIAAAKAAGMGMIVALGPESDHKYLQAIDGVDLVITTLKEFPKKLLITND